MSKDIDGLPFTEEGFKNAKAIFEAEYGQPTEIVNAYIKSKRELPIITGANPRKVKEFYKQLRFNVQSLDTLGRLADVKGNVRCTLDRLKGIKADLVRGNKGWKDWGFLTELQKWTQINPVEEIAAEKPEKDPTGKRNQQFKPPLHARGAPRAQGLLRTKETNSQRLFWEKQAQRSCDIERDRVALNLQPNQDGLLECRGRIQGEYPVYIPETSMLGLRLVEEAHQETLLGGVGLTMAKVRTRYWIPNLRQPVKKVRCHGCKRFQASAYVTPPTGNLPTTRTRGTNPYQMIGVDYAGPIRYRVSKQREGKAYVLLYAWRLTRRIYLDLLPNLETAECLKSMKHYRTPRTTRTNLFRQWPNLCRCSKLH